MEIFTAAPSHRFSYSQARNHPRYPAQFPILVKSSEYRLYDEVLDLSEAGVGVSTRYPMPPMTLVKVQMEPPHERQPIELVGRVVWSRPGAMGIRFEQSNSRLWDTIERIARDLDRI